MGVQLGKVFKYGDEKAAVVTSVSISQNVGEFTRLSLELIVPTSFGLSDVGKLDLSKIFQSPTVNKAINDEIQTQMRKITFDDR